jgi:hypothetical protein
VQLPVSHEPLPFASNLQLVRPQKRPSQPFGTVTVTVPPLGARYHPPRFGFMCVGLKGFAGSTSLPSAPTQIGWLDLLTVIIVRSACAFAQNKNADNKTTKKVDFIERLPGNGVVLCGSKFIIVKLNHKQVGQVLKTKVWRQIKVAEVLKKFRNRIKRKE